MESYIFFPLLNCAFTPGHCYETVLGMKDSEQRDMAMAEYHYFSGHAEEAAEDTEPYLASEDTPLRLTACLIYAYANLATDHIRLARHALTEINRTAAEVNAEEDAPQVLKEIAIFTAKTAAVMLHLPLKDEFAADSANLMLLPPGLRFFSCYVLAHYAYLEGDYGRSVGVVETSLALQPQVYPIPTIYLHLAAAMSYMGMRETEKAKKHLLTAWELARPDGLIEAFSEHHDLLGGLLEATLKKDWPEDFKRIIGITYTFGGGWRKVHNQDTGHDVADNLTTTEFAIAMLASREWTYQEISSHMGISLNTVKSHMKSVLSKLGISKKSELHKYMLR